MLRRLEPRLLSGIDCEPWFALFARYNTIEDAERRRELAGNFSRPALEPIPESLKGSAISFHLADEIALCCPTAPQAIAQSGHALSFYCPHHRPLLDLAEPEKDLGASSSWRYLHHVQAYRAPRIKFTEGCCPVLEKAGFRYRSSIYAASGSTKQKGSLTEVAVNTLKLFSKSACFLALPRDLSLGLVYRGELPCRSSFKKKLIGEKLLRIVDRETHKGHRPVMVLYPIELFFGAPWSSWLKRHIFLNPKILFFARNKSRLLRKLVARFPTSSMKTYLDELQIASKEMYE